jgi:spore germination cell wall hydrolase CwlJ-like protein
LRTHFRAAALAAAAIGLCAAAGFTAPSLASETESGPAISYLDHAAVAVQAAEFGVNALDETASDPAVQSAAPIAVHERAPALPAPVPAESSGGDAGVERDGRSLAALVDDFAASETNDEQTDCLARAVYYESKGEPLSGQLTVAEVVINRAESGRFPSTLCGVVRQRGQFSFVRGGHIPTPPQGRDWRTAVAIARIAMQDLADGGAPRALFFHARHVRPGWRHTRVATIGNHIFYR